MFRALSPAGRSAPLSILIFHRVHERTDPMFPGEGDAARFDGLMAGLRHWCQVLPLDEALQMQREGRLPARAAAITFDDGYRDNHDVALPILQRHRLNACFFISTGFLDGGRMWNDTVIEVLRRHPGPQLALNGTRLEALGPLDLSGWPARRAAMERLLGHIKYLPLPERQLCVDELFAHSGVKAPSDLMMDSEQVLAMRRAGMVLGGHTVNHPILARLEEREARHEMAEGKRQLESLLGEAVQLFAYPNGKPGRDYTALHARLAREVGFAAAVTTAPGAARIDDDPFQVPRFTPWDFPRWRFGLRMVQNLRQRGERAL
ncbi:polysaccharide deacetylase family protein [Inhella proteolytica]|nr:polysaccharide deacetylase family protein [Inhella proteolytica]